MVIKPLNNEAWTKLANDYPRLDFSFQDDYREEVEVLLQEAIRDTLRQVVKWGKEPCFEHLGSDGHSRWHCIYCQEELKQEASPER